MPFRRMRPTRVTQPALDGLDTLVMEIRTAQRSVAAEVHGDFDAAQFVVSGRSGVGRDEDAGEGNRWSVVGGRWSVVSVAPNFVYFLRLCRLMCGKAAPFREIALFLFGAMPSR